MVAKLTTPSGTKISNTQSAKNTPEMGESWQKSALKPDAAKTVENKIAQNKSPPKKRETPKKSIKIEKVKPAVSSPKKFEIDYSKVIEKGSVSPSGFMIMTYRPRDPKNLEHRRAVQEAYKRDGEMLNSFVEGSRDLMFGWVKPVLDNSGGLILDVLSQNHTEASKKVFGMFRAGKATVKLVQKANSNKPKAVLKAAELVFVKPFTAIYDGINATVEKSAAGDHKGAARALGGAVFAVPATIEGIANAPRIVNGGIKLTRGSGENIARSLDKIPAKIGKPLLFENWKSMSYTRRKALLTKEFKGKAYSALDMNVWANDDLLTSSDVASFARTLPKKVVLPAVVTSNKSSKASSITPQNTTSSDEPFAVSPAHLKDLYYNKLVDSIAIAVHPNVIFSGHSDGKTRALYLIRKELVELLKHPATQEDALRVVNAKVPIIISDGSQGISFTISVVPKTGKVLSSIGVMGSDLIENILKSKHNSIESFQGSLVRYVNEASSKLASKDVFYTQISRFKPANPHIREVSRASYANHYVDNELKRGIIGYRKLLKYNKKIMSILPEGLRTLLFEGKKTESISYQELLNYKQYVKWTHPETINNYQKSAFALYDNAYPE